MLIFGTSILYGTSTDNIYDMYGYGYGYRVPGIGYGYGYRVHVAVSSPDRRLRTSPLNVKAMDVSVYAEQRYKDGLECARRATQFDQEGHFSGALSFYSEAVEALTQACSLAPSFSPIMPTVHQYSIRAEKIREYLSSLKGRCVISWLLRGGGTCTSRDLIPPPPPTFNLIITVIVHIVFCVTVCHVMALTSSPIAYGGTWDTKFIQKYVQISGYS